MLPLCVRPRPSACAIHPSIHPSVRPVLPIYTSSDYSNPDVSSSTLMSLTIASLPPKSSLIW